MGLTKPRATQIYNLDYKQATRVVTIANITLSGGAPATVDGISLSVNDRILVTAQSIGSQNGIYKVATVGSGSTGTWVRTTDANDTGEIEAGMIIMVTEGAIYADTQWKLITDNPITLDSTALTFTQNYSANSISGGTSNVTVYSNANVTISSAGTPNVLTISSTGTVTSGTASVTGNITGGNANITGTTAATSKTTGALVVGGGVGVASDVWAGNSITVDGGSYGNVVITQFASVFATGVGPNPRSIMQVRGADNVSGIGIQGVSGSNGQIYANTGIIFTTGATVRDKDFPTGGTTRATIDSTGLTVTGLVSATGNITGNYIFGNGSQLTGIAGGSTYSDANVTTLLANFGSNTISATGNVTAGYFLGNGSQLTGLPASYGDSNVVTLLASFGSNSISTTGNVTASNLNSSNADLAEMYISDSDYPAGTVVEFGGAYEITVSNQSHSTQVAGIISTEPSYLMNSSQAGEHVLAVALTGRVPCRVVGTIRKGDRLVASGLYSGTATTLDMQQYQPGCIIGKSLKNYNSEEIGVIEVAVGRT